MLWHSHKQATLLRSHKQAKLTRSALPPETEDSLYLFHILAEKCSFIWLALSLKQGCNKGTKIKTKWPKLQTANDLRKIEQITVIIIP